MTEPTTINKILTVPNTGDLTGSWGTAAMNPNFTAIDGILGGLVTISATTSVVTLTTPTGTASPGAGPFQSQNAIIRFSGTLTGNMQVVFSIPGYYIVENLCAGSATSYIQLQPSNGTGNNIGAPPGQKQHVFFDGTHMDYVNMPAVGSYMDLAVSLVPTWMNACTIAPWLACLGQQFNTTTFSNLNNVIGTSFGGTVSAPLLPDMRGRYRATIDGTGARITSGGSGINGSVIGAAGGNQLMQVHNHGITDPGHVHVVFGAQVVVTPGANTINALLGASSSGNQVTNTGGTNITINAAGGGASGNVPPMIIGGISFIKT